MSQQCPRKWLRWLRILTDKSKSRRHFSPETTRRDVIRQIDRQSADILKLSIHGELSIAWKIIHSHGHLSIPCSIVHGQVSNAWTLVHRQVNHAIL